MTDVEAGKLLTMLVTAFPDGLRFLPEDQQRATLQLYRAFLLDLEYEPARHAFTRLIATSKRWPPVAELRSAVLVQQHGAPITAGQAWGAIRMLTARRHADELRLIDPVLRVCLESLGWLRWSDVWASGRTDQKWHVALGDNETADRARFLELYETLQRGLS